MARPQIDIKKYIIGGVDDFGNREDLDRNEAWEHIILSGLEAEQVEGFYEEDEGSD
jgi:hypothetical protein